MQIRGEIKGAVTAFSLITAFLLAGISIDFGIFGPSFLQSLRFHIAAALMLGVLVLFVFGAWRRALLFFAVVAVSVAEGGFFIYRQQEARAAVASLPHEPLFNLLSFNTLNTNTGNGPVIAEMVATSGADVAVLLEGPSVLDSLARLDAAYRSRAGCEREQTCDLLVLSKTPLSDIKWHSLSDHSMNRALTAKTTIGEHTLTIVAVHMTKPYFDGAWEHEAHALGEIIDGLDGPLVLVGDLNSAAWSDGIERLVRNGNLLAGPQYPATWPTDLGPAGIPIDNVFTRAPLITDTLRSLDDPMGSNHRGLWAEIGIAE